MNDYIIDIKNLVFEYDMGENKKIRAINDVSISIKRGEFVAVLGHNGSGKSTLAKLINCHIKASSGEIYVDGLDVSKAENILDIRRKCAMVFQNPDNQIVATVVEEDVAFGPENLGIKSENIRKIVDDCLMQVGLEEYKSHSPALLSGGQKQRLAIAGVLAMNPDCILMDEATAMLDPLGRREIMEIVRKLNKEKGKTVVYITHYMEEAIFADRVIVMDNGEISIEGTPEEVFSQVDEMRKLGLDVPQATEIAYLLNKRGFSLNPGILTIEELVKEL